MRRVRPFLSILLAASGAAASQNATRPGQPETLAPAPPPPSTVWAEPQSELIRHGSPRFLVFWEIELHDDATTQYRDVDAERIRISTSKSRRAGVAEVDARRERYTEPSTDPSKRSDDASLLETTFTNELRRGGVRFVDRSLAIRLQGEGITSGERVNTASLETAALRRHANYLLQVTSRRNGEAPRVFRVSVRDLETGEVRLDFELGTTGEAAGLRYVATDGGFEPVPSTEADHVRALAREAGERLLGSFRAAHP